MPWGLKRFQESGQSHFVTFCCYHRRPSFTTNTSKRTFENALERIRGSFDLCVYGYVVMPEHVHLLLTEPPAQPLSKAIASIKREVSRLSPQTPFWLPRYYDFNVFTQNKRIEKLKYIHRNPVARALAGKPEDYPWSSFRAYALLEPGPVTITREL